MRRSTCTIARFLAAGALIVALCAAAVAAPTPVTAAPSASADANGRLAALAHRLAQGNAAAPAPGSRAPGSAASAVASAATQPASAAAPSAVISPIENTPLGAPSNRPPIRTGDVSHITGTGSWVINTLTALGVVIGLILLLRWVSIKVSGRTPAASHSPIVEVLSRTTVAPRNHVLLLRVGGRILVVGDSSTGLRTLAEVEDPDEVADLLAAVTAAKPQSISQGFTQMLSRFNGDYDEVRQREEGPDTGEHLFDRARDSISSLRSRIRTFSNQKGRL